MSMISKQIDDLRAYAKDRKGELAKLVSDAADTIEMLSAKLSAANMERSARYYHGGWIPCGERLPEVGKDVMVCYDFKGHRSVLIGVLYGDEKFHGYDDEYLTPEGRKYRKAVAWMPLPEPWRGGQG